MSKAKPTKPKIQKILLAKINTKKTQTRAKINKVVVDEYAALMNKRSNPFPPSVVYQDKDGVYLLSDGFHRFFAALKKKLKYIACEVRQGTLQDALRYAFTANDKHGLRRTNADKRKAVTIVFEDKKWSECSDRTIAKQCGVSNNLVTTMRKEQRKSKVSSRDTSKRTGADGKKYPATKPKLAAQTSHSKTTSNNRADVRALELLTELRQVMKTLGLHKRHGRSLTRMMADVKAKRTRQAA